MQKFWSPRCLKGRKADIKKRQIKCNELVYRYLTKYMQITEFRLEFYSLIGLATRRRALPQDGGSAKYRVRASRDPADTPCRDRLLAVLAA